MRNLLRASLFRIRKERGIWYELGIVFALNLFILLNGYYSTNITNAYVFKLVSQFFGHSPLIGFFAAVFASKLWGVEYESGALRNKLICGHRRRDVYLSNLFAISSVGLSVTGLWILMNLTLGIFLLGVPQIAIPELAAYVISDLVLSIALSAVCCLIASMADREVKGLLGCLVFVAATLIVGLVLYKRFSIEQYSGWLHYRSDPPWVIYPGEEGMYVGGFTRILLELAICLLPEAQGILLLNLDVEHLLFPPASSLLAASLTTCLGMYLFRRRDLR